jgi:hypothetical protein
MDVSIPAGRAKVTSRSPMVTVRRSMDLSGSDSPRRVMSDRSGADWAIRTGVDPARDRMDDAVAAWREISSVPKRSHFA